MQRRNTKPVTFGIEEMRSLSARESSRYLRGALPLRGAGEQVKESGGGGGERRGRREGEQAAHDGILSVPGCRLMMGM